MTAATATDPRRFRTAMGRFATGVTVVTTRTAGGVHGMTANGFLSVSLDPPLILVSLGACTMARHLHAGDRYAVTVLSSDQEEVSRHFGGRPSVDVRFDVRGRFDFIPGGLAFVGCRIVDRHPAGDHTLFLGEVEHLDHRDGTPLLFYTGSYRTLNVGLTEDVFFY
ncbi:flavin reductase family protein [Amycolatopsis thermophila]|uniref:Flavin reductase (DIM6/NTAB) family NADH-FMN oxidoreductase RutF n=1 Tax=Amycolatopsis thermophila TaxID=206084 RepID=A0ABU0F3P4_9PSEU|nr:flavin reductase family protein [Amycolatopsis thermophila]MDQ0382202.1 flavin reductase (DIM6/NTAB) family NADH-FMN oxidoreductase RutF [Amycolatopsis thermophila]